MEVLGVVSFPWQKLIFRLQVVISSESGENGLVFLSYPIISHQAASAWIATVHCCAL